MPDRKVAIWIAVSSGEQAKLYSLETQHAECHAFFNAIPSRYPGDTATLVAEISMADTRSIIELSEAVATYPQSYGILYSLIKRRQINTLICVRRDRLGREDALIMTIEAICRANGVKVVALKSNIPPTLDPVDDEGSGFVVAIEAVASRIEVKRLQGRKESGMLGRVTDLLLFPGRRPWGYSYRYNTSGKIEAIVMDPAIKIVIRFILIDLYLVRGNGAPMIADILNEKGILSPRGQRWVLGGVRAILDRAARYAGWIEYHKSSKKETVRVKGNYEPMITEAEYQAISAEMESRKYESQRRHGVLSGIVYCAGCNQRMHANIRKRKGKATTTLRREYCCKNPDCQAPTTMRDITIMQLLRESFAYIATLEGEEVARLLSTLPVDVTPLQLRLRTLFAEQIKLQEERKRAIYAYVTLHALTDDEFSEQEIRIKSRLLSLEIEIEQTQCRLDESLVQNQASTRLSDVQTVGLAMLDRADSDPELVNQWLRKRVMVIVRKGKKGESRTDIRLV